MINIISGLPKEIASSLTPINLDSRSLKWISRGDFVTQYQESNAIPDSHRYIWLYCSPWTFLTINGENRTESLSTMTDTWCSWQSPFLRSLSKSKNNILIVNLDRIRTTDLASLFGLPHPPTNQTSRKKRLNNEMTLALARLLDWTAPHAWKIFEQLETFAWIPEGKPFFRSALQPPSIKTVELIAALIHEGSRLPNLEKRLDKAENKIATLKQINAEIQSENELIIDQLQQVQRELERYYRANQKMQNTLSLSASTMKKARKLLI